MNLGNQLKTIRKGYGLTQQELAQKTGVSFSFINGVENGRSSIRLEVLSKVLELLGCELAIIDKKSKKIIEVLKP
jgi:y4mF family transcriptional regulator